VEVVGSDIVGGVGGKIKKKKLTKYQHQMFHSGAFCFD
jgi:hypothetical protein